MGRARVLITTRLSPPTVEYLDDLSGPEQPLTDRGRAADWCVREVRRRGLIRKPYRQHTPAPERMTRVRVAFTMAREEVDFIDGFAGPPRWAFKTRNQGVVWCLETAQAEDFRPTKAQLLEEAARL